MTSNSRASFLSSAQAVRGTQEWYLALLAAATASISLPGFRAAQVAWGFLIFAPVLWRTLIRHRQVSIALILLLLCIVSAVLLVIRSTSSDNGRQWNNELAVGQILLPISTIVLASVLLWSLDRLGVRTFLLCWSPSAVLVAALTPGRFEENPWKFGLALPASIFLLAIVPRGAKLLAVLALVLLSLVSIQNATRSWLIILAIALGVLLFLPRRSLLMRRQWFVRFTLLGILTGVVATAVTAAALRGYLGFYAQQRTEFSIQLSGNPLFGQRAEWGGAWALFLNDPFGFGPGISPSRSDYALGVSSLTLPEGLKDQSNVAKSFIGGIVEFHSGLWNFWSMFGLAGLAFVGFLMFVQLRSVMSLQKSWSSGEVLSLPCAVVLLSGIWNLLFSPFSVASTACALAIGLWLTKTAVSRYPPGENEVHRHMPLANSVSARSTPQQT